MHSKPCAGGLAFRWLALGALRCKCGLTTTREVARGLSDFARNQLPFATALAVNEVLQDVVRNTQKRMRRVIDRPTPFTLRGFAIRRASKRRLVGQVFAKDIQGAYLRWLETGGTRAPKGRANLVPVGARLNKFGNLPRGAIGRTLARPKVFSGSPKGRPGAGGIYQRMGRGRNAHLRLLVHYAARSRYRPALKFIESATKTTAARLPGAWLRAFQKALATAR